MPLDEYRTKPFDTKRQLLYVMGLTSRPCNNTDRFSRLRKNSVDAHNRAGFEGANARIPSGCSKRLSSKAAARSATRRIMSVTFADGRESVSAQCLRGEAYHFTHPPRAALAALARWYVEPLSDARTPLADFFSILLE